MLYAIFGNLLRWSYGYSLLSSDQDPTSQDQDKESSSILTGREHRDEIVYTEYGATDMCRRRASSITLPGTTDQDFGSQATNKAYQGQVNESSALLPAIEQVESDQDDDDARSTTKTLVVVDWARSIHQSMTPPLYAALLALIVGLVPFLKQLMYHSILYPTLTSAIQSCSKASVPITLVCLGAQLCDISSQTSSSSSSDDDLVLEEEGQHHLQVDPKPVATAIGIRMGLVPLIVIPLVLAFVKYNGVAWSSVSVATDPVFGVMMIILGCTPTAINLVQISQVTGAFEKEMLRVLFWSYGVICIPVFTMIIFAALNIVQMFI